MNYSYRVDVREYECPAKPARLAVGDVIRSKAFQIGLIISPNSDSAKVVHVGWGSRMHIDYYIMHRSAVDATDELRASAPFLVTSITLEECVGPADVGAPARLSRMIRGVRLTEEHRLEQDAERIVFWQDEPMALASPNPNAIELVGYATLPIGWDFSDQLPPDASN